MLPASSSTAYGQENIVNNASARKCAGHQSVNNMEYPESFKNLLVSVPDETYIGTGNPNAKILIIGNEPALDLSKNEDQYKREILGNLDAWRNEANKIDYADIQRCVYYDASCKQWIADVRHYNPLFPYKGQLFKKEVSRKGKAIHNGGVGQMWLNQQKLVNSILGLKQEDEINFHMHCFSTDFSTATALRSSLVNPLEREKSINDRVSLFRHSFFNSFPIIIVACGHYVKNNPALSDLTEVFRTSEEKIFIFDEDHSKKDSPWINVHRSISRNRPAQILVHTHHLASRSINDKYFRTIAELCRDMV